MAWSWYTKGRRIPTIIGKDVSGRRIPGGPYTGLQAVTAAAVPALLWTTRGLWAADMAGLAMFAVLIGATVAAVKLVGKVDFASRNPLLLLASYVHQTGRPTAGTLAGRKLAEPKPHRVTAPVQVAHLEPVPVPVVADAVDVSRMVDPVDDVIEPLVDVVDPSTPAPAPAASTPAAPADQTATATTTVASPPVPEAVTAPGTVGAALRPATAVAPDRRRPGLEAFLAGAAAARTRSTDKDAA